MSQATLKHATVKQASIAQATIDNAPAGVYISVEDMLQLRHVAADITLESNKKSIAIMDGDSRTRFRGRGMEFSEVRAYQAGDDIRNIDWRVTARTQKPHTKLFQEERERPVYILVDQRSPMFFGSKYHFKSVYAAKLAAIIAWAALRNNDRIGALIFSDTEQTDSRARRGKHAVLAMIHELVEFNHRLRSPLAQAGANAMVEMLNDIRRIAKPGSSVYLISDFHDFSASCHEPLAVLARHTDVTLLQLYDELERMLPGDRLLALSNGEDKINIAGQSAKFSQSFTQSFERNRLAIRKACNQAAVNFASIAIAKPVTKVVHDVFCSRKNRTRGGR